ncbi:MAG: glycosyltransferase family 9 protein [Desulfarculaceae bacterium]|nr:glycosyltransferase family 9 protein [Desulfarculaceae bacterium]
MTAKLKGLAKVLAYRLINLLLGPRGRVRERTLLLIRLDLIGDYVLFRDFIAEIRRDPAYANHRLTLVGNAAWRELAQELDGHLIDEAIWLDRARFERDLLYRWRMLRRITRHGYHTLISPMYSRYFWDSDNLARVVRARHKIASAGDCANQTPRQRQRAARFYTRLTPARPGVLFEFERNREFCEGLLGRRVETPRPRIEPRGARPLGLPRRYAVLFIGGSSPGKKWSLAHWGRLASHLAEQHGLAPVLCGGPEDAPPVGELARCFPGRVVDLVGRTSLTGLLPVLAHAELIVSNDTSAPHMAVALGGPPVVVIYGGNYLGRCLPYPRAITQRHRVVYHSAIAADPEAHRQRSNAPGFDGGLDLNQITPEMVAAVCDEVLGAGDKAAEPEASPAKQAV